MSRRRLAVTGVAALVLLLVAVVIGRSLISSPGPERDRRAATPTPTPSSGPARPAGFVRFDDRPAGFSIAYPRAWKRLDPVDKQIRLLVTSADEVSLLIRQSPLGLSVTTETLPVVRDLTDSLVRADKTVKLVSQPEPITLDGVPGYRYVYTYGTGATGRRGAHVHYFLFRSKRLLSLVFQVPGSGTSKQDLEALDTIAGTFRAIRLVG